LSLSRGEKGGREREGRKERSAERDRRGEKSKCAPPCGRLRGKRREKKVGPLLGTDAPEKCWKREREGRSIKDGQLRKLGANAA